MRVSRDCGRVELYGTDSTTTTTTNDDLWLQVSDVGSGEGGDGRSVTICWYLG